MNLTAEASDPPHVVIRRAVSGTKRGAESAGRLLLTLPTDPTVEAVLTTVDPRFWIAVEEVRDRLDSGRPKRSDTLPALMVKALSPDGRVREKAVRRLAKSPSLAVLPVLGLRAADWVSQVRAAARAAIAARLDHDPDGAALITLAPMAFRLADRYDGHWLAEEVTRRLATPAAPVVSRLLGSRDVRLRRAAYKTFMHKSNLDLERAVHAAINDPDILVRTRCAAYASHLAVQKSAPQAALLMLNSRTPLVRAEALQALNRFGDRETIRTTLADRSALVRGTARFYLRPHGVDFPEIYRRLLAEAATTTPGAVAGLTEVGTADDADLFRSLLTQPRARVRIEALKGLAGHARTIAADVLLTMVETDPSAAVARQAAAIIVARSLKPDTDRLLAMLGPAHPTRVRLAAHLILTERDTAWRLAVNAMLLADAEPAVADRAKTGLTAALQRQIYVRPSGKTAELLTAHLADVDRHLSPREAGLLRFVTGTRPPVRS